MTLAWLRARSLTATALLVGVVGPTTYVATAASGCTHVRGSGAWTTIDSPDFPGSTAVGGSQLHPAAAGRSFSYPGFLVASGVSSTSFFASDQLSVMKTADGGCSWHAVYSVDPEQLATAAGADAAVVTADQQYDVQAITAARYPAGAASGARRVYGLVGNSDSGLAGVVDQKASPVFLITSANGGDTWDTHLVTSADNATQQEAPVLTGLNGNDGSSQLLVAPTQDSVVYLVLSTDSHPEAAPALGGSTPVDYSVSHFDVYLSKDSGATWHYRSTIASSRRGSVSVDPADPGTLWTFTRSYNQTKPATKRIVSVSHDFGLTWTDVHAFNDNSAGGQIETLDVLHPAGRPAVLLVTLGLDDSNEAFHTHHPSWLSTDAGRSWRSISEPITLPFDVIYSALTSPTGDIAMFVNAGGTTLSPALCLLKAGGHGWTCGPPALQLTPAQQSAAKSNNFSAGFHSAESMNATRTAFLGANNIGVLAIYAPKLAPRR